MAGNLAKIINLLPVLNGIKVKRLMNTMNMKMKNLITRQFICKIQSAWEKSGQLFPVFVMIIQINLVISGRLNWPQTIVWMTKQKFMRHGDVFTDCQQ